MEFELIQRYFNGRQTEALLKKRGVILGIGDDAAMVSSSLANQPASKQRNSGEQPESFQQVIALDSLVAGVHFPKDTDPAAIGHKALAVNLSDLAAMGAEPETFTLALTLPNSASTELHGWLTAFSQGLFNLANAVEIALIGGDTTAGPLSISIQVSGRVPAGQALLRSKAKEGDDIYVSGLLGGAAAELAAWQETKRTDRAIDRAVERNRLDWPQPRLALGQALRLLASAAIDISDGFIADLKHLLKKSGCAAELNLDNLPRDSMNGQPVELEQALYGGDDYELCFTAAPTKQQEIQSLAERLALPLTRVGCVTAGSELSCFYNGQAWTLDNAKLGYQHFSQAAFSPTNSSRPTQQQITDSEH